MRRLILASIILIALPALAKEEAAAPPVDTPAETAESAATGEARPSSETATTDDKAVPAQSVTEIEPARDPVSADSLTRETFTTLVEQREPVDTITSLTNDHDQVFYFTELVGIEGRQVIHRWEYDGEVVGEVPIAVGGPRWRAYSVKSLEPGWLGEWKVSVVDESGHVVHTATFVYEETSIEPGVAATSDASAEAEPAPPAAPSPEASAEQDEPTAPAAPTKP